MGYFILGVIFALFAYVGMAIYLKKNYPDFDEFEMNLFKIIAAVIMVFAWPLAAPVSAFYFFGEALIKKFQ